MTNAKVTKQENGTYDISLDLSGNLNLVDGIDEIIQNITTNILLIKGEWFIDIDSGVDYFSVVFNKQSTRTAIDEQFIIAIENTDNVIGLTSYSSTINRGTRELIIRFNAKTSIGNTGNQEVNING